MDVCVPMRSDTGAEGACAGREAGPGPGDQRAFRRALGRFATGVTVVTCRSPHGPVGMTVNSFASLSLDPPLVMWSPAKASRRAASFSAARRFAIHVLGAQQRDLADAFMRAADAFATTGCRSSRTASPASCASARASTTRAITRSSSAA